MLRKEWQIGSATRKRWPSVCPSNAAAIPASRRLSSSPALRQSDRPIIRTRPDGRPVRPLKDANVLDQARALVLLDARADLLLGRRARQLDVRQPVRADALDRPARRGLDDPDQAVIGGDGDGGPVWKPGMAGRRVLGLRGGGEEGSEALVGEEGDEEDLGLGGVGLEREEGLGRVPGDVHDGEGDVLVLPLVEVEGLDREAGLGERQVVEAKVLPTGKDEVLRVWQEVQRFRIALQLQRVLLGPTGAVPRVDGWLAIRQAALDTKDPQMVLSYEAEANHCPSSDMPTRTTYFA
jgi:hypothetical protein